MTLDEETKQFIVRAIDAITQPLVKQINDNFEYVSKRFDDVDRRLSVIESKLNIVQKDTTIIPQIFGLLEQDDIDIVELTKRIDNLEK